MSKSIVVVIGALDTKGDQIEYIKDAIERRGNRAILIDVGVLGEPMCEPDITRHQVAQASGMTLEEIIAFGHEAKALEKMTEGAEKIVKELYAAGNLDGILALGGSMGTALALEVYTKLPLSLPKVMLSTIAYSPAIDPDLLSNRVIMLQWASGLWGINDMVREVLEQAAAVVSSAAELFEKPSVKRKTIGMSSGGMAASQYTFFGLRPALMERGYDVAMFHITGMNTRVLERAIEQGLIAGVLDISVQAEFLCHVTGSPFSPGPHRLEAAAKKGIPQVVTIHTPGIPMAACFWSNMNTTPVPAEFAELNENPFVHNSLLYIAKFTEKEWLEALKLMLGKLNKATGPTAVVVTKGYETLGFSGSGAHTKKNGPYSAPIPAFDDEKHEAHMTLIRGTLNPEIKLVELDENADTQEYVDTVLGLLDEMMPR